MTGGICLIRPLGGSILSFTSSHDAAIQNAWPEWLYAALIEQRASILRNDSFRSLLFVLLTAGVVWLYSNGKIRERAMFIALGAIVLLDMWPVDRRFLNDSNYVTPKQN